MRWPDIFFKSRKPKFVPEPAPAVPTPSPEMVKKREQERSRDAEEKADSLRALTESGGVPVAPRGGRESISVPTSNPADVKTSRIDAPPARPEAGAARTGAVSLRQRAKLTEDALVPPRSNESPVPPDEKSIPSEPAKKTDEPAPSEAPATPAAVVPAAFPVAVETGTVLDKPAEKAPEFGTPVTPSPATAEPSSSELPASRPADETATTAPHHPVPTSSTPPRETTHVHLGDTTPRPPSAAIEPAKASADSRGGKQEFILANGERILGHILSETPQSIYLDHDTLGVLTLPRSQIAKKPIEVILINGDRIVGDLIAETPECLYIKHASLGMLTVPHNQRSTRVVEAIMKDGDRILGEVLAETGNFTVIRSATLGTVAVQHDQVAMLNRKIEQMQLRSLPRPGPRPRRQGPGLIARRSARARQASASRSQTGKGSASPRQSDCAYSAAFSRQRFSFRAASLVGPRAPISTSSWRRSP